MEVIKSQRRFFHAVVLQCLYFERLFHEQHWFCFNSSLQWAFLNLKKWQWGKKTGARRQKC